jgi:CRISPR/Cas system CMR-associated protein Cmr3 (group 5 of RAMP superfamily)
MIYVVLGLILTILVFGILIWLRKVQFDAVHQNFLDLVDKYGGRVIRDGFAIRPKFSGLFKECRLSISISSEKKTKENPRRFYISIYYQSQGKLNFTVMSNDWLNLRQKHKAAKRITKQIAGKKYSLEVSERILLKRLDLPSIEKVINKMHPFAYVLVSHRGLILERISNNLIADTEYEKIQPLLEAMHDLSLIPPKENTRS